MFRSIEEVLSPKFDGKKVAIRGWVYRKRDQKELIFLVIRDSSDIIQAVIKKGTKPWKAAQKITIESSCELKGTVKRDKRAPTGYELQVSDLKIVGLAERFPITRDKSPEFLLDMRHLWLRSRELTAVMKVRSTVFRAIDDYFRERGYWEIQSPMFTSTAAEGGATLFPVKYFDRTVYLAQTWQLYAEAMIFALEKIYCIAPSFRAEKSRTTRHLTEFWHAEVETAWQDFDALIKQAEELVSYICQRVTKERKKELKILGVDAKRFQKIKPPFPQMTYDEALKKLKKKGMKIPWGKDLRTVEEKKLTEGLDKPLIVTRYPKVVKAFYMKEDPKDSKLVLGFDILVPKVGEIIGASERETDIKKLLKELKAVGEAPKKYGWYFDTRKYGTIPHSGFGLGVDRVVQWICGLKHIRDAIPFPRDTVRTYP